MKYISLLILLFFLSCCKNEKCDTEGDPKPISFRFILTDKDGADLFFGPDNKYNPDDVKWTDIRSNDLNSENWPGVNYHSDFFYIAGYHFSNSKSEFSFLLEISPEKFDTIRFKPSLKQQFDCLFINYDTFFNEEEICVDCDMEEIYKIKIKKI